jgi:uncharacterized membrane protein YukC
MNATFIYTFIYGNNFKLLSFIINITFKDFLKKSSLLSNDFIDDFFGVYDFNENENDSFIINLDVIAKWLETRKRKIKETLVKTYILSIDYVIKLNKQTKVSKINKENILLTPDCFKRLCLLSKTKKSRRSKNLLFGT